MFPDDDRVFPSKIEAERTSSVAPVRKPDNGRHQPRIMEVKTNVKNISTCKAFSNFGTQTAFHKPVPALAHNVEKIKISN